MNVNWTTIKQFIDSRNISIQWVELEQDYKLIASDDYFKLECSLDKNPTDNTYLTDFETNYKGNGNKVYKTEVVTQLEKDDKTLKIAKAYDDVDAITGEVELSIKVPGTPGSGDGRYVLDGTCFFGEHHVGDYIEKIEIVDVDNLLGYGSGAVLETYHDSQATTSHHGWWMPPNDVLKAEALGGYGFIPSGFYMRIKGKKGSGITTGSLYLNLRWGKHST